MIELRKQGKKGNFSAMGWKKEEKASSVALRGAGSGVVLSNPALLLTLAAI